MQQPTKEQIKNRTILYGRISYKIRDVKLVERVQVASSNFLNLKIINPILLTITNSILFENIRKLQVLTWFQAKHDGINLLKFGKKLPLKLWNESNLTRKNQNLFMLNILNFIKLHLITFNSRYFTTTFWCSWTLITW